MKIMRILLSMLLTAFVSLAVMGASCGDKKEPANDEPGVEEIEENDNTAGNDAASEASGDEEE